ncbi:nickel insertion protein [Leptolinea tardivitalis]|uniref:nickel insertion protein n=1 Tax=Leptolinea tardivitalis TaxID=229920 RepID=UPI00111203DC|nr:nickel insertion protein [Leptolinea tardivitalis]
MSDRQRMEKLFAAGLRDVFLTPIPMKRNRPGTLPGVIALWRDEARPVDSLLGETTTLGLRVQSIERVEAHREFRQVDMVFG